MRFAVASAPGFWRLPVALVSALFAASLLTACDTRTDVERYTYGAIEIAKAKNSAADALAVLDSRVPHIQEAMHRCTGSVSSSCDSLSLAYQSLQRARKQYLVSGLAQLPVDSLPDYFHDQDLIDPADDRVAVRTKLAERIVEGARVAKDIAENANLRYLAGTILYDGTYVLRDSTQAATLLARAWSTGEPRAAGALMRLYQSLDDPENALLWALRCTATCAGNERDRADVGAIQARLSTKSILEIEAAAQDTSILTINNPRHRPAGAHSPHRGADNVQHH